MNNIKKILFIGLFFFLFSINVNATIIKARINYSDVRLRTGPGTNYTYVKKLAINSSFNIVDQNKVADEQGCSDGWYRIYYNDNQVGYVCSAYVVLETYEEANETATTECEIELASKGFPQSYWTGLCNLKMHHPNWQFESDLTGLDFPTAISKESVGKMSLIQTPYQGYLSTSTDSYNYVTDTFVVKEGSNWYSASPDVVAYYMDPRNFFDETYIFMFEKLSFDSSYQTLSAVQSVLSDRDINAESETIYNAASEYNVNAIYLASRIRQETGGNYTNYSLSGRSVTNSAGVYYAHIYNPYNIGANTGAGDGLVWAATGTAYLKPWVNLQTAIRGGASFISSSYIAQGQDTGYFQKFNTSSYCSLSAYSHQYMTNIKAAYSEASLTYNGYKSMNLLDTTSYTFVIPVYNNMKVSNYELPNTGNPNNHLSNIIINGSIINNFAHDKYEYTYYVPAAISQINLTATSINSNASISGIGNIPLSQNENILEIVVTAQNGAIQKYSIKVIKTDGLEMNAKDIVDNTGIVINDNYMILSAGFDVSKITSLTQSISATANVSVANKLSGNLATGDLVTITNGSTSVTLNVVIKGDPTGDGNINIQDLLRIQKYILGYSDLSGSYLKAGDTNQDGIVDIVDLLRIQKHILGYLTIN